MVGLAPWEASENDAPPHGSLADVAYRRLLTWIMDGTLGPAEPLPLAQIAAALGISQTPLRESLARLEGQGLVVRLPMRGFRVAEPLSKQDVDALMDARLILEPAIAHRAAKLARPEQVAALREALERSQAVELGPGFEGYRDYLDLSAEFHDMLGQMAGNRFLRQALDSLPVHVQRFRLFGQEGVTDRDVALSEHQAVFDAVVRRDPEAASRAMRRHIRGVRGRSLAASRSQSDSAGPNPR